MCTSLQKMKLTNHIVDGRFRAPYVTGIETFGNLQNKCDSFKRASTHELTLDHGISINKHVNWLNRISVRRQVEFSVINSCWVRQQTSSSSTVDSSKFFNTFSDVFYLRWQKLSLHYFWFFQCFDDFLVVIFQFAFWFRLYLYLYLLISYHNKTVSQKTYPFY